MTLTHTLVVSLRMSVAAMLAYAGVAKLGSAPPRDQTILPPVVLRHRRLAMTLWYTAPLVEVLLALGIAMDRWPNVTSGASAMLLMGFAAVLGDALRRGYQGPCTCFGTHAQGSAGMGHVMFVLLVGAALAATLLVDSRSSQNAVSIWPMDRVKLVSIGIGGVALLLTYRILASMDEFADISHRRMHD